MDSRMPSASSNHSRKSAQASRSRRAKWLATASTAHLGSCPKVAVLRNVHAASAGNSERTSAQLTSMLQPLGQCIRHFAQRTIGRLLAAPLSQLDDSLPQLLAHRDAIGNADQVGVLEFHPGALVAIVEQNIHLPALQLPIQRARSGHLFD